ncbi:MAG: helix-turn-helix transcriptional regulator [Clostridia bacterium]|nr:helix-turn-helix transcriptional regulator [Clostridia bacterium]
MSILSETIASLRREANETQSALADALGVSNRTVSKWENAESEPEASLLSALADHFGTTVDALLGRREKDPDPYEGITRYDDAALKYFDETLAGMNRLQGCFRRIFNSEKDEENNGIHASPVPAFPWKDKDWSPAAATSHVFTTPVYAAFTAGTDVNLAVSLFPSENGDGWLERNAGEIADALKLLADPRALRLVQLINAPDCPSDFTVAWAAEGAGMTEDEADAVLRMILDFEPETVELEEGSVRIARWHHGNPRLLAALALFWLEVVNKNETRTSCFNSSYRSAGPRKEEKA